LEANQTAQNPQTQAPSADEWAKPASTEPSEFHRIGKLAVEKNRLDIAVTNLESACIGAGYIESCGDLADVYAQMLKNAKAAKDTEQAKIYASKACVLENRFACTELSTLSENDDDSEFDELLAQLDEVLIYYKPMEEVDPILIDLNAKKADKIWKKIKDIFEAEGNGCSNFSRDKKRYALDATNKSPCIWYAKHLEKLGDWYALADYRANGKENTFSSVFNYPDDAIWQKNCDIGDDNFCEKIDNRIIEHSEFKIKCNAGNYEACASFSVYLSLNDYWNFNNWLHTQYRLNTGYRDYIDGDYVKSMGILRPLCTQKEVANRIGPSACTLMAIMYDKGLGIERNAVEATKYYHLACNRKQYHDSRFYVAGACMRLSEMYIAGDGVGQDAQKAKDYRLMACDRGYAKACK